ncbi:MAG: tyrosine-type recombinase/integrase [Thaumarchaeota archaeon]|nr:tyrosine-type recombinase/integrase [Nitrososphaerota archaeon]
MILPRSLSKPDKQPSSQMQIQTLEDKITNFLNRKFRISKSFATKRTYESSLRQFNKFLGIHYNFDLLQLLHRIKESSKLDPIEVLDNYYTYLSQCKRPGKDKLGYSAVSIKNYIKVAKEFLNGEGCKIYNEDVKQRFRLPRTVSVYQKGLTKEIINRLMRLANRKLAACILVCCSSGMRLAELVQLRLSDIDFTTNPTTIILQAETTKTRQARITHISSEATQALKDYLTRLTPPRKNDDYVFLLQHEDRIKRAKQDNRSDRVKHLEFQLVSMISEERYAKSVATTCHNLQQQLDRVIRHNPELNKKSENSRSEIHFHAFRAWFKTQVTDAHQSDFAEALMGHQSLKLVYYRQSDKARTQIYRDIEHAVTIADTEKIDQNYSELQKDNLELRGIVDNLSRQLTNLEKRIEVNS